jgi:MOB kinase activator 1
MPSSSSEMCSSPRPGRPRCRVVGDDYYRYADTSYACAESELTVQDAPEKQSNWVVKPAGLDHMDIVELHLKIKAEATLGIIDFREAVKKPKEVEENPWIGAQFLQIYEEANHLVSMMQEFCDGTTCPCMNAGVGVNYLWPSGDSGKPTQVEAMEYMGCLLMTIIQKYMEMVPQTHQENSADTTFPKDFKVQVGKLMRRQFRIYAHAYRAHFGAFKVYKADAHLNGYFKHFLYFVLEFNLVTRDDMLPLKTLIETWLNEKGDTPLDKALDTYAS